MIRPISSIGKAATAVVAVLLLGGCSTAASSAGWTFGPTVSAAAPSKGADQGLTTPAGTVPSESPTAMPATVVQPSLTFTPGTNEAPRIVEVTGDDFLNFTPGLIQAVIGETVTFRIKNLGKATHEFMVGPLADAFADKEGTPEVADIGPGQTGEITFTFDGPGPFAFACHAPGHYEHGMIGYVQVVGPDAPAVGTPDNPRVVWMNMTDNLTFMPDTVTVAKGETIRFVLTNSGTIVHEFQVGPSDKVAADQVDGTIVVEQDELDAGSTHAVDYTFDGPGPYGYACHEPGHYEAGMKGTVIIGG